MGFSDLFGGAKTTYQTSTVSQNPWSTQVPHLENVFEGAEELYDQGPPAYYPDSTVIPFSPESELALQMTQQRALDGSPLNQQAQDTTFDISNFYNGGMDQAQANVSNLANTDSINQMAQTANGSFLNTNPYLNDAIGRASQPVIDQFNNQVAPSIDGSFAANGRYGSGAYANARNTAEDTLTDSLSEMAGNMSYTNYNQERGNQLTAQGQLTNALMGANQQVGSMSANDAQTRMGAASMLPGMANLDYSDATQLANVGAARESFAQSELNDKIARYNYDANQPWDQLAKYSTMVSGGYGGTSTESTPMTSNPASSFLGNASTGAAIGNMVGGESGAGWGAAAGGLLSMFG